jgi:NADPH:quinone reductase-like Zn-dependent oxidoreductase
VDSAVQEQGRRAGVRVTDIMVEPDHAGLQHLRDLVDHGSLTTDVGAVVPIDEAARAHRMLQSREVAGKVILSIPD